MKGYFKPKNPKKYKGDYTNIVYRSSWELKLMMYLDSHDEILSWGSETIIIPYRSPIDNRIHRYFVDFIVTKLNTNGLKETILIEVKPKRQTVQPIKPKKITKRYITESKTWAINNAKWEYAENYCKNRGWTFKIFTEKELGLK